MEIDYKEKYQELKERIDALSIPEDEKKRIKDEEELFASRGWEDYIALAVEKFDSVVLKGVRGTGFIGCQDVSGSTDRGKNHAISTRLEGSTGDNGACSTHQVEQCTHCVGFHFQFNDVGIYRSHGIHRFDFGGLADFFAGGVAPCNIICGDLVPVCIEDIVINCNTVGQIIYLLIALHKNAYEAVGATAVRNAEVFVNHRHRVHASAAGRAVGLEIGRITW